MAVQAHERTAADVTFTWKEIAGVRPLADHMAAWRVTASWRGMDFVAVLSKHKGRYSVQFRRGATPVPSGLKGGYFVAKSDGHPDADKRGAENALRAYVGRRMELETEAEANIRRASERPARKWRRTPDIKPHRLNTKHKPFAPAAFEVGDYVTWTETREDGVGLNVVGQIWSEAGRQTVGHKTAGERLGWHVVVASVQGQTKYGTGRTVHMTEERTVGGCPVASLGVEAGGEQLDMFAESTSAARAEWEAIEDAAYACDEETVPESAPAADPVPPAPDMPTESKTGDVPARVTVADARAAGAPRNLVKLANDAAALGWETSVEVGYGWVALELSALIRTDKGSAESIARAVWSGGRWDADASTVQVGGREVPGPVGYRQLVGDLSRTVVVDRDAEAAGALYKGRSAGEWAEIADHRATVAEEQVKRAYALINALSSRPGNPEWAQQARTAAAEVLPRMARRSWAARAAAGRIHREVGAAARTGAVCPARWAFDVQMRARALAAGCLADANAMERAPVDAEGEAARAEYVSAMKAERVAEETAWRAVNPMGTAGEFAAWVIRPPIAAEAEGFAQWWEKNARPGMTFWEGWDALHSDRMNSAENLAWIRVRGEIASAVFALARKAAAHARRNNKPRYADKLIRLVEGNGEYPADNYLRAMRVWGALSGAVSTTAGELDALDRMTGMGAAREIREVRRLLLIRHGLMEHESAESAKRRKREAVAAEQLSARRAARRSVYEGAFEAAQRAGEDRDGATEAAQDAAERHDAKGNPDDGRSRFPRGAAVWVAPRPDIKDAPYVGRVARYLGDGVFAVRELAYTMTCDIPAALLTLATESEAAADLNRQERALGKNRAERERRNAERHARDVQEAATRERLDARTAAARTAEPPATRGREWAPVHQVPNSIGDLWELAARYGWKMSRYTEDRARDWQCLTVFISGTTEHGLWAFRLTWTPNYGGGYSLSKAASRAKWADGRSGPRGGEIRPTIRDVSLVMMSSETQEGLSAPLGVLVGAAVSQGSEAAPDAP
ncbi:hypothetical protein [Streptomyces xiamenensis]|uniref:hypothetical protein n=1 Tax=Streptomyces xiamenensis TaxID=408015 RepID=UPI0035E0D3CA